MSLDSKAKLLGRGASLLVLTVGLTAAVGLGSAVGCGGDSDSSKGGSGAGGSPSGSSTSNTGGTSTEPTTSTTTTSQENGGGGSGNGGSNTGGSANGGSNAGGSNAGGGGGSGGGAPVRLIATCAGGGTNLLSNVVAWYHGEGNANDAYGNNNGSVVGPISYSSKNGGGVGLAFDVNEGAASYVSVPNSTSLSPTKAITLEAWVNATALGGRFISKLTNGSHDGYLLDSNAGKLRMIIGTHSLSSTTALTTGTWTHVAGVYDGANMTVYINGIAAGTVAAADAIPVNALPLILGADESGANGFKGLLDEVRIHDRGFTAGEVATLYRAGVARNTHVNSNRMLGWFSGDTASLDADILQLNSGTAGAGVTSAPGVVANAQVFTGMANVFSRSTDSTSLGEISANKVVAMDAWINPTANGGRIFDKMTPAGFNGFMLDTFGGKLRLIVGGSTVTSTTSIPLNTWTHVAADYDGANMKIFINGVEAGTLAKTDAIPSNVLPLTIGADSGGGSLFAGAIDEARIYGHALVQADVTALYNETHCQ